MYLVKTPSIIKAYYAGYTWDVPNDEKEIYLTFDDGPTPEVTQWVIKTLHQYNVKATFFCLGRNIAQHSSIYQQLLSQGHRVGNHGYDHLNGWRTTTKDYVDNAEKARKLVNSPLFRPPYGRIKKQQGQELHRKGCQIVMWDVISGDFDTSISSEQCLLNVTKNVTSGSIIVFHDSAKAQNHLEYTLPKALEFMIAEGYKFGLL